MPSVDSGKTYRNFMWVLKKLEKGDLVSRAADGGQAKLRHNKKYTMELLSQEAGFNISHTCLTSAMSELGITAARQMDPTKRSDREKRMLAVRRRRDRMIEVHKILNALCVQFQVYVGDISSDPDLRKVLFGDLMVELAEEMGCPRGVIEDCVVAQRNARDLIQETASGITQK